MLLISFLDLISAPITSSITYSQSCDKKAVCNVVGFRSGTETRSLQVRTDAFLYAL